MPAVEDFKPLKRYSNWCDYDCYADGKEIEHLDIIAVKWPNGIVTRQTVEVENTSYQASDHGKPWIVPVHLAYIKIKFKGDFLRIRLRDCNVTIRKIS